MLAEVKVLKPNLRSIVDAVFKRKFISFSFPGKISNFFYLQKPIFYCLVSSFD